MKASKKMGRMRKECRSWDPRGPTKDFIASWWSTVISLASQTLPPSPALKGRCLYWSLSALRSLWLPFFIKPDPCTLHFSDSFASWLLVNFCQSEALVGNHGEEGSKSQVVPSPFPSLTSTPSLPSVASHRPVLWFPLSPRLQGLGYTPFFSLQLPWVGKSS